MSDAQAIGFSFFGATLACYVVYLMVCGLASWVDRNSPLNRADRRHLRSVQNGKRAQGFKSVRQ